jgi:anti-anti-sigma regulatory factor
MFLCVRRRGGRLALLRPSPRVSRVLRMTHLTDVFEVYEREEEALCSFAAIPLFMPADSHGVAAG